MSQITTSLTRHVIIRYASPVTATAWEAEIDERSSVRLIRGCVEVKGPAHAPYYLLLTDGQRVARLPRVAR